MQAWEAHDPTLTRPIAAPLEQCAELLGVDLTAIQGAATHVEPYVRIDGTKVWSLMQLERHLRPDAYGRVRGGYIARRRPRTTGRVELEAASILLGVDHEHPTGADHQMVEVSAATGGGVLSAAPLGPGPGRPAVQPAPI